MVELTTFQAVAIGLLQGVTELFPISSLGHSVLVPALIGGSWRHLVTETTLSHSESSPYLAFIVALHVASAVALIVFYWNTWVRIIKGFVSSVQKRAATTADERLAWLLIIATVPVGITGLIFEHSLRVLFAKPMFAAIFLIINGLILLWGESLRKQSEHKKSNAVNQKAVLDLTYREAGVIGLYQMIALLAGISRSGISMVGGLTRGLNHEDSANFSFLLATPVILAAGLLKLPSLLGPAGEGIHSQVIIGALVAGIASYLSVRFLTRYFKKRKLTPFAWYCIIFGLICLLRLHFKP